MVRIINPANRVASDLAPALPGFPSAYFSTPIASPCADGWATPARNADAASRAERRSVVVAFASPEPAAFVSSACFISAVMLRLFRRPWTYAAICGDAPSALTTSAATRRAWLSSRRSSASLVSSTSSSEAPTDASARTSALPWGVPITSVVFVEMDTPPWSHSSSGRTSDVAVATTSAPDHGSTVATIPALLSASASAPRSAFAYFWRCASSTAPSRYAFSVPGLAFSSCASGAAVFSATKTISPSTPAIFAGAAGMGPARGINLGGRQPTAAASAAHANPMAQPRTMPLLSRVPSPVRCFWVLARTSKVVCAAR
jgi:hypothetical protein